MTHLACVISSCPASPVVVYKDTIVTLLAAELEISTLSKKHPLKTGHEVQVRERIRDEKSCGVRCFKHKL
ncbi:hypothetical protein MPER_13077 [Moniliophthora perniciosa FA553]|nr:hypothetical protein MPER_13077 [Moniliophthora perniciosa FA553]